MSHRPPLECPFHQEAFLTTTPWSLPFPTLLCLYVCVFLDIYLYLCICLSSGHEGEVQEGRDCGLFTAESLVPGTK